MIPIFALAISAFVGSLLSPAVDVKILMTGQYHSNEISVKTGEVWYGVYHAGDGFTLIESRIKVEQVHDAIVDQSQTQKTGLKVSVDQPTNPIFLVKGIPNLTNRTVKTVFFGNLFVHPNNQPFPFFQFSETDRYVFEATAKTEQQERGRAVLDYSLKVTHSYLPADGRFTHRTQELLLFKQIDMDNPPSVLWAGDLDGDGKLDLLMEEGNHYNLRMPTLYLSSMARGNTIVEEVAALRTSGC